MSVIKINWGEEERMPPEMRRAKRWLLYKMIQRPDGKADKVPYYINGKPRNGTLDSPEDVNQLSTYAEASEIVESSESYAGLGFALGLDGEKYWQGIDLDRVYGTELESLAKQLPGYVETSPSGTGVHAIGYGEYFNGKNEGNGIEYYAGKRFFTFTGKMIRNGGLTDLKPFIKDRINPELRSQLPTESSHDRTYLYQTPEQLDEIRTALTFIPADCVHDKWKQILFSLARIDGGVELWAEWSVSSRNPAHRSSKEDRVREGYRSLLTYRGEVNISTLFHHAMQEGYKPSTLALKTINTDEKVIQKASRVDLSNLNTRSIPAHEFIIPNWLPTDAVTLFAGHGGTGKSWIALQLAIDLAYGRSALTHQLARPYSVVYLSGEDSEASVLWRAKNYMRAAIIEPDLVNKNLHIMNWSEKDTQVVYESNGKTLKPNGNFDELVETCKEYEADVLIVDNNSMFFGGNEIDRAQVQMYLSALRHARERLAVIALHHVDKASVSLGNTDAFSGSTGWHNGARARWSIGSENGTHILALRKSNYGKSGFQSTVKFNDQQLYYDISAPIVKDVNADSQEKIILTVLHEHIQTGGYISISRQARKSSGTNAKEILLKSGRLNESLNEATIWGAIEKMVEKKYLTVGVVKTAQRKDLEVYAISEDGLRVIFDEEDV